MRKIILSFIAVGLSALTTAKAQQIDFNMSGRQEAEGTEIGYTPWAVDLAQENTLTLDGGITLVLTSTSGVATHTLRSNYWKAGVVNHGSKLVCDAVVLYGYEDGNTPNLTDESGTLTVTIHGLSAGEHSLLAYHNNTNNKNAVAPLDVAVNGEVVLTAVTQSPQELLPSASGQSYVEFTVKEGEPVAISYTSRPDLTEAGTLSNVYINALVFDQPNPKATALDPYPMNNDIHVDADKGELTLSWTMASSAVKNHLYVGTSIESMTKVLSGESTSYTLTDVYSMNNYYWRVDQEDASGVVYQGNVWMFRPRQLAFPGAEGYGKYATGGRGGIVYHVTSLDDDVDNPAEGTFRYGIRNLSGPRTIVFDVSGVIHLKGRLTCSDPFVTIAGQTAPGKGILFRGAPFGMASEGITRFIRSRRGYAGTEDGPDESEQNKGLDGLGMAGNHHSIMDHCSVGWTTDEAFSSRNCKNITLQRTLISEALNCADHPNYGSGSTHGFAATIGGDTASYHHNLLVHNAGRNWSLSGGLDGDGYYAGHHDIFNNVCYNWEGRTTDGGTHECNFVNNFYKMGPSSGNSTLLTAQLEGTGKGSQAYYVKGNIRQNKNGSLTDDKEGTTYKYQLSNDQVLDWDVFVDAPYFPSKATIETAKAAFKNVLSDAGCNQPALDAHDIRMVSETLNGTTSVVGSKTGKKGIIDREWDAGCEGFTWYENTENFPALKRADDFDTDRDGMPDWWERAKGSNPSVADNNEDSDRDGYTALEDYLNWLAEPHHVIDPGKAYSIELKPLFAGYANAPVFTTSFEQAGCTAAILGSTLTLTPDASFQGFIAVPVSVTDADDWGTLTRTIQVYVDGDPNSLKQLFFADEADNYIYTLDGRLVRHSVSADGLAPGIYLFKNALSGASRKVIVR